MMDGSYYASGRRVFRRPLENQKTGALSMGFAVCKLVDGVSDDGAQEIADALNAMDAAKRWNEAVAKNREEHEA